MTGSKQRNNWPTSCGSYETAKPASMSRPSSRGLSVFFGIIIVASLCLGSIAVEPPSLPTIKKRPERLHSPRGKELYSATAMAIVLPPKSYALTWEYRLPIPRPGVLFVIEAKHEFESPWIQIGVTNKPPFPIATGAPKAFFRVGSQRQ